MMNGSNISGAMGSENPVISWYWWLCGVLAVLAVLGNGLIIFLIITRSQLQTTQNAFVLSLAIADFLVGIAIFPLRLVFGLLYKNVLSSFLFQFYDFLIFASITNLCAMTLDRYMYIIHPLKHTYLKKIGNIIKILAFAWIVSFIISLINVLVDLYFKNNTKRIGVFILKFGLKGLLCVFLILAYVRILRFTRRKQSQINIQKNQLQHNYPTNIESQRGKKNSKLIGVLGGVIGFFVISCLLNIINAYLLFFGTASFDITFHRVVMSLVYANSAINVFIYGLLKRDIRLQIKKVFCKRETTSTQARNHTCSTLERESTGL